MHRIIENGQRHLDGEGLARMTVGDQVDLVLALALLDRARSWRAKHLQGNGGCFRAGDRAKVWAGQRTSTRSRWRRAASSMTGTHTIKRRYLCFATGAVNAMKPILDRKSSSPLNTYVNSWCSNLACLPSGQAARIQVPATTCMEMA